LISHFESVYACSHLLFCPGDLTQKIQPEEEDKTKTEGAAKPKLEDYDTVPKGLPVPHSTDDVTIREYGGPSDWYPDPDGPYVPSASLSQAMPHGPYTFEAMSLEPTRSDFTSHDPFEAELLGAMGPPGSPRSEVRSPGSSVLVRLMSPVSTGTFDGCRDRDDFWDNIPDLPPPLKTHTVVKEERNGEIWTIFEGEGHPLANLDEQDKMDLAKYKKPPAKLELPPCDQEEIDSKFFFLKLNSKQTR